MYEETKNQPEYLKTLHKLAELYAARCVILLSSCQSQVGNEGYSDDAVKCAETIQKIIDVRRDPSMSTPVEVREHVRPSWRLSGLTLRSSRKPSPSCFRVRPSIPFLLPYLHRTRPIPLPQTRSSRKRPFMILFLSWKSSCPSMRGKKQPGNRARSRSGDRDLMHLHPRRSSGSSLWN